MIAIQPNAFRANPISISQMPADLLLQLAELSKDIGGALELQGLPMPAYLRNVVDPLLQAWRRDSKFDALLAVYEKISFDRARAGLLNLYTQLLPDSNMGDREFRNGLDRILCHLQHRARQGGIIEPTDALDQLLQSSDLHSSLPLRLFALPFPALYLHCAAHAAEALTVRRNTTVAQVEGIYCFTEEDLSGQSGARSMHLIVLLKQQEKSSGVINVTLKLTDGDDTLETYFANFQKTTPPEIWDWYKRLLDYVTKISLYMGLKEARVVNDDAHTMQQERLRQVGTKKQAKLARQCARLYDRIIVGPERLHLPAEIVQANGHIVSPHWRRGHFRMQPHGPNNTLRKLMFIAPVLVAMEHLTGEPATPAPKRYQVDAR